MKALKWIILGLYGVTGLVGWYKYTELQAHPVTAVYFDKLSPEMTVTYVRSMVWYHSRGKLQELRSILMTDNLDKRQQIETRIKNMLQHRTSAYIRDFNSLDTPVKNIGNWYQKNFDFDNFLSAVYSVVFDMDLSVEEKIRNISDVMEEYQNITNQKLNNTLLKITR